MRGSIGGVAAIVVAAGLAGCASVAPPPPPPAPGVADEGYDRSRQGDGWYDRNGQFTGAETAGADRWRAERPAGAARAPIDLTPWLDVRIAEPAAEMPIGSYTRLRVTGQPPEHMRRSPSQLDRTYMNERRGTVERWLWGQAVSRVLSIKVSLNQPGLSVTLPLASSSHRSTRRDGEMWLTDVNPQRAISPYFRVHPQATATVETTLNASSSVEGNLTFAVLGTLIRATELASPGGELVTSLNEDGYREAANFLDQSLARLLGENITERSTSDLPLTRTGAGGELTIIAGIFPMGRPREVSRGEPRSIGEWRLTLDPPIVSIFADTPWSAAAGSTATAPCATVAAGPDRQACVAFQGVTAAGVLGLRVGDQTDLRQAVTGDTGIQNAITRVAEATEASRSALTLALCEAVAARAEGLGLNRYDAAATVWALAQGGGLTASVRTALAASDCQPMRLARAIRLAT